MTGFVLAMGRSGTMWLASAIHRASSAHAQHESIPPDGDLSEIGPGIEVSSFLRHRINEIKRTYPKAPVLHLVRDGRRVVRSALARNPTLDLAGACHAWTGAVWRLSPQPYYRLEDLTTDVGAFSDLCSQVGASCDEDAWEEIKGVRINATRTYGVEHYTNWPLMWKDTFWSICGPMMRHYGYA